MKTASQAVAKWQTKAQSAGQDYHDGATQTTKDQAAAAIAAKGNWQAGLTAAFGRGAFEKGLQQSGKQGWIDGVTQKGVQNYSTGVSASKSASKYAQNSGKYDSARTAANSAPRGPKGSAGNLNRVTLVANAQHAAKVGA